MGTLQCGGRSFIFENIVLVLDTTPPRLRVIVRSALLASPPNAEPESILVPKCKTPLQILDTQWLTCGPKCPCGHSLIEKPLVMKMHKEWRGSSEVGGPAEGSEFLRLTIRTQTWRVPEAPCTTGSVLLGCR
jgi:hypothetical protein